jgi:hypothetical protein
MLFEHLLLASVRVVSLFNHHQKELKSLNSITFVLDCILNFRSKPRSIQGEEKCTADNFRSYEPDGRFAMLMTA